MPFTREDILAKLRRTITDNRPIIIAGAGTGISAKFEEAGGVDLIIIYNSGKYRMAGRGSIAGMMPYGDANAIVMETANEVLPVIRHTPVLAGVCGTDPFRSMDHFLNEIKAAGFSGVQNFPTVGIYDGVFRHELEETGISFQLEVQMIQKAGELDLFTAPYVFMPEEAQSMAGVGADMIVVHLGPTVQVGKRKSKEAMLQDTVHSVQKVCDAAHQINSQIICLCHGGPISKPQDVAYILQHTDGVHGFCGASSVERFPTEMAIEAQMKKFKAIKF